VSTAPERQGIQSVHRAFDLLELIGRHGEIGVSELARQIQLPVSTVHSLIRTLAQRQYVLGDGGRYRLGPGVTTLNSLYDPVQALAASTHAALEALAERTGLAATATVLVGREARNLGFVHGSTTVTTTADPARWTSPLRLATGRLLVATTAERDWASFLDDGAAAEPTWSRRRWLSELRMITEQHYAARLSRDPRQSLALGVPVWSGDGAIVAAIGCSVPAFLAVDLLDQAQLDRLWLTTTELSAVLGCRELPDPPQLDPRLLAAVGRIRQPR
jgi:IclR family transcriptional regulator, KDG regulon repressor